MSRAQSNVVGVALLLGIAVVSMGTLTATVGIVVESSAAAADAERVASGLDAAFEPVGATGPQRGSVSFSEGRLYPVERTLEVRADGAVVDVIEVDAVIFESGDRRVAYHAGGVIRGRGRTAWMDSQPPITVDEDVIVIGITRIGDDVASVGGSGGVTATLATDVSHDRRELGEGTFSIAVETAAPNAWANYFHEQGAVVDRESGDRPTVVGTFEGARTGYLIVHELDAEVS